MFSHLSIWAHRDINSNNEVIYPERSLQQVQMEVIGSPETSAHSKYWQYLQQPGPCLISLTCSVQTTPLWSLHFLSWTNPDRSRCANDYPGCSRHRRGDLARPHQKNRLKGHVCQQLSASHIHIYWEVGTFRGSWWCQVTWECPRPYFYLTNIFILTQN